jgi:hypothetical protein
MTLKQRALLDVIKMLVIGVATGSLISLSAIYIGSAITYGAVAVIALAYLTKVCYDMRVSQLQFEADRVERALKK